MEALTYQQIITAAISLLAIVVSVVSLRRTSRVQDQQLRLQRKQEELTDLQLEALRKQAATPQASGEKADVRIDLEPVGSDHRFMITNWGRVPARDVRFALDIEPGKPSPLINDYAEKIPIAELAPGGRVPIYAALSMGMPWGFPATWSWRNPDGSTEERKSLLAI
jgi:hypothetical protein